MALQKLETTDAFVVRDFDDDVPALGIVRSAPKILQGGAKELARSQTYMCAVFNMKCQGASAGVCGVSGISRTAQNVDAWASVSASA